MYTHIILNEILAVKIQKHIKRAAWVAQRFSTTFSPGCDPGDRIGLPCMESVSLSVPLSRVSHE